MQELCGVVFSTRKSKLQISRLVMADTDVIYSHDMSFRKELLQFTPAVLSLFPSMEYMPQNVGNGRLSFLRCVGPFNAP